ncbi:ATP-binding protein [Streptomyces sp. NBC_00663]|uniref:ATP-binding protein n=1 Tax=Streptomyces sp. NBC_00663 TaxID=2975801 RepID=UPI002E379022|nr:ATP-binding protein [Streptomyces sp. NBC_00663]
MSEEAVEWQLPRHPRSVGRSRARLREQAADWKLPEDVTDTAVLLLSELMTNAYRHAHVSPGREIRTRYALEDDGRRLRVSVTDASDTMPTFRNPSPEDESGRGLILLTLLADTWGTAPRRDGVGKTVWFSLDLDGITPAVAPSPTASAHGGSTAATSVVPPTHGTPPSSRR